MGTSDEKTAAEWVNNRLAELKDAAGSIPSPANVHERLSQRIRRSALRRRVFVFAAVSLSVLVLVLAALPSTRLVAQRVWIKLRPRGIVVVRKEDDPKIWEGGFLHWDYSPPAEPLTPWLEDINEAAIAAGFVPRLPDWKLFGEKPSEIRFRTFGASSGRVTVDATRLRQALREQGKTQFNVPESWDGLQFVFENGPGVVADFDRITFVQQPPSTTSVPAGISGLDKLWTLLETPAGGLSAEQRLRLKMGGVLQGIEPDPHIEVHDVGLKSGPGVFAQNNSDHETRTRTCFFCPIKPHESVVAWIVPDRQFIVRGYWLEEKVLLRFADSIH